MIYELVALPNCFHEEVTRSGRSRKKSRKQQDADRDALFGKDVSLDRANFTVGSANFTVGRANF